MHRIWRPGALRPGEEVDLEGDEARRLRRVLRLRSGDCVTLFNDQGQEGVAEILGYSSGKALLRISEVEVVDRESPLRVHLVQALVKGDRMAWVIQKATELGVQEIGVLLARRSVPDWKPGRGEDRLARWRRIALEAGRQCGRTSIPLVSGPWDLATFCDEMAQRDALKCVLWEREEKVGLSEAIGEEIHREVWLVVGPEGGLEMCELRRLAKAGFQSVRMGPRILRTETAGIVFVAILQYLYGDLV